MTSSPLSTAGLATAADNRECPQPPTAGLSSRTWQEKRALPPNARCSSGLLPARKRDSVPRREVTALESSANICVQSGRLSIQPRRGSSGSLAGLRSARPGLCQGAAPGARGAGAEQNHSAPEGSSGIRALESQTTGLGFQ